MSIPYISYTLRYRGTFLNILTAQFHPQLKASNITVATPQTQEWSHMTLLRHDLYMTQTTTRYFIHFDCLP